MLDVQFVVLYKICKPKSKSKKPSSEQMIYPTDIQGLDSI